MTKRPVVRDVKIAVLLFLQMMSVSFATEIQLDKLLHTIHLMEASGRMNPPDGDHGRSIGPFQISQSYWLDAVSYDRSIKGTYQDCHQYNYAKKVVVAYLKRYAGTHLAKGDIQAVIRIHNGGPDGWRQASTQVYWNKASRLTASR